MSAFSSIAAKHGGLRRSICGSPLSIFDAAPALALSAIVLGVRPPGAAPCDDEAWRDQAAQSLASLVDAYLEGVVGEVILVGAPAQRLDLVALELGCGFVEAEDTSTGLAAALRKARHSNVFVLVAGHVVGPDFAEEVADLLALAFRNQPRLLRSAPELDGVEAQGGLATIVGIVAPRSAAATAKAADIATLAEKLGVGDLFARAGKALS